MPLVIQMGWTEQDLFSNSADFLNELIRELNYQSRQIRRHGNKQ